MIKCRGCKKEKLKSEFYPGRLKKKDYLCKDCSVKYMTEYKIKYPERVKRWARERMRRWRKKNLERSQAINRRSYENNKEKINQRSRKKYQQNPNKFIEYKRQWRISNPDKQAGYSRRWYKKNIEKVKAYKSRYRTINKDKIAIQTRKWRNKNPDWQRNWNKSHSEQRQLSARKAARKKRATAMGKLNNNMASAIWRSLNGNKNFIKWEALVGYSLSELKAHLEKYFAGGMNWTNYGKGKGKWNIDHIIPKSAFNFVKGTNIDFKRCWSLKNLQPLWEKENISKSNKLNKPFQPSLAL